MEDIYKINKELKAYNEEIAARPQVIAANKTDVIYAEGEDPVERLKKEFEPQGIKVFPISAATGAGIEGASLLCIRELLEKLHRRSPLSSSRNSSRRRSW